MKTILEFLSNAHGVAGMQADNLVISLKNVHLTLGSGVSQVHVLKGVEGDWELFGAS